jgi:hypothetical protein
VRIEGRDVSRLRTQARLLELALRGLLDEARLDQEGGRTPPVVLTEARTACELVKRAEVALGVALRDLERHPDA